MDRLPRAGKNWFLYDLKFDHVTRLGSSLDEYLDGIDRAGIRHWVVLRRRNLLAKLVSGLMAGQRGGYHTTDTAEVEHHRVRVDVGAVWMDGRRDSMIGHFDRCTALYAEFHRLSHVRPVLELEYESDILEDPRVAYNRTLDFLGLAHAPAEVRLKRLNTHELADVIENFAEVVAALAPTPYAWMLEA